MLPEGFVFLDEALPGVKWDAKYFGSDNFMGRPANGYKVNRVVLTREAAACLGKAYKKAQSRGYGLMVFDAYRPTRAVRDFCAWGRDETDTKRKAIHYPNVDKRDLFKLGYIAEKSSHSRGSAIDLTLTDDKGVPLDMGGIFDFMDELSWHDSPLVTPEQTQNRERLREIMLNSGFEDYEKEWWHYRVKDEPYPDTYFDFEIE